MRSFSTNFEWREYDIQRWVLRKEIYLSKTRWVDEGDYTALKSWLVRILHEIRSRINLIDYWTFNIPWRNDYNSPDWYQNQCVTTKVRQLWNQVWWMQLARLLIDEPYQNPAIWWTPHYDFMVIDKDLTEHAQDNYEFIYWLWPYPINIISTRRFRQYYPDIQIRLLWLELVAAHEFWHNLHLTRRNFNIWTTWLQSWHCMWESGPCVMEQVEDWRRTLIDQIRRLAGRVNILCQDCTDELAFKREYLRQFWQIL